MAKAHTYKFCFGPWNLSEGRDPCGSPTGPAPSFDWKPDELKTLGFDAMMFHDDVPDIDKKTNAQVRKEARELKAKLDDGGIVAFTGGGARSRTSFREPNAIGASA